MGLFDNLKDLAIRKANDVIDESTQSLRKNGEELFNEISDSVKEDTTNKKEQTGDVISNNINTHLEKSKQMVQSEDGKEDIQTLQNLVNHGNDAYKDASSLDKIREDTINNLDNDFKELDSYVDKDN